MVHFDQGLSLTSSSIGTNLNSCVFFFSVDVWQKAFIPFQVKPCLHAVMCYINYIFIPFLRLTRILTRLPALRLMNSSITEELFFTGLIGNVSIDSIIPYILKMETAEYNNQDSDSTE